MSGHIAACFTSSVTWRKGFLLAAAELFAHVKRCDLCLLEASACEAGTELEGRVTELRG